MDSGNFPGYVLPKTSTSITVLLFVAIVTVRYFSPCRVGSKGDQSEKRQFGPTSLKRHEAAGLPGSALAACQACSKPAAGDMGKPGVCQGLF